MFRSLIAPNLIFALPVLALVAWAAPEACAKVVFDVGELRSASPLGDDAGAALRIDLPELDGGGMSAISAAAAERARRNREDIARRHRLALEFSLETVLRDASGASSAPGHNLTSAGSGPGGFALATDIVLPPETQLQANLSPEAKLILPTGPPYEFFRPPKA